MRLAKRVQNLKESPTLAVTAKAKTMKAKGWDIISFGAGEPDCDTPDNIKEEAIRSIEEGFTKYTKVGGIDELKDAIIEKFRRDNGLRYSMDEILVSCGGKHSFFNLCQALVEEGDEVIIPAPYWVSYPAIVRIAGGTPVIVPTNEDGGFRMTPEMFESHITPATKAVIINSPSNPTGAVYSVDELEAIAEVAVRMGVLVVSDEIYEKLCYDGTSHVSIASLSREMKGMSIVLNGVSKAYSMTGWRIGYAAGPKRLIKAMTDIQSQSTSNPTSISQKAAAEAIRGPQDSVLKMREGFKRRRKVVVDGLNSIDGVSCMEPAGAFYVFPNIAGFLSKRYNGTAVNNSVDFANFLLDEAEIAVVPGVAFGAEGHIRISYAVSMEDVEEGIKRMREAVDRLE